MNLSALMSSYNLAKHFGRRTGILEPRLADRALGYLMSGRIVQKAAEYGSTRDWCGCPDSHYRRRICKHSIAVEIQRGHDEIMEEFRWRCDCCGEELPESLLESDAAVPKCPYCGWPADRPRGK